MSLSLCKLVNLPTVSDDRGSLSFLESGRHIPFEMKRIYYIYDVPKDASRGYHAHKKLHQLCIPIYGSLEIKLDDGKSSKCFQLNSKSKGLYICPMIWREMYNFEEGTSFMVIASEKFSENDYIRNYQDFLDTQNIL
tara:strand:- start:814 stop:1224 length:411 start_codon:yes stop_codon:yes gene_type:complete